MKSRGKNHKGGTIVAHEDLISFLHKDEFGINHKKYDKAEFEQYKKVSEYTSAFETFEYEKPQILHALVMLTNRCNMSCKYCYTEANEHLEEGDLTGDKWIELFEKIRIPSTHPSQNISFTGGEPTVHKDFVKILESVSGKYKIEISTNGLVIKDDLLNVLKNVEGLNFVNISMDSYKKEEDEFMRGKNTFNKRLKNIKKLHKAKIPLAIGVVVNHATVNSLKKTTEFYLENFPGLRIKYIPIAKMGAARRIEDSIFLTEQDSKIYLDSLFEMKHKYSNLVLTDPASFYQKDENFIWSGRCSHMRYESEKELYLSSKEIIISSEKCNAARGVVSISSKGNIRPCLRADSFFEDIFSYVSQRNLMPSLVDLTREEIGNLDFWKIVKQEANCFCPKNTCALKYSIKKNGEDIHEHKQPC